MTLRDNVSAQRFATRVDCSPGCPFVKPVDTLSNGYFRQVTPGNHRSATEMVFCTLYAQGITLQYTGHHSTTFFFPNSNGAEAGKQHSRFKTQPSAWAVSQLGTSSFLSYFNVDKILICSFLHLNKDHSGYTGICALKSGGCNTEMTGYFSLTQNYVFVIKYYIGS